MHWSPKYRGASEQCPACRALVRSDAAASGLWWCGKCHVWWGFILDGAMPIGGPGAITVPAGSGAGAGATAAEESERARRCS